MELMRTTAGQVKTVPRGSCNARVTTSTTKCLLLGKFDMWTNKQGIAHLLSIPQLEDDGFIVKYDTRGECAILAQEGKKLCFNMI